MRFFATVFALAATLALTSAAPTPSQSSVDTNNLFMRQASCMDHPCDFDTNCFAWRCGACGTNRKCECPPESEGGPC
ncbi:hypothetical protein BKA66DRAFT_565495 [Pyrenochaeta sp. MPI-SDFR-AT-0127]|nr:hypothetical protein BKA66DRAFT_565495 [Pyrenochaeta sp. MPI-SDFR-AT-0127]